MLSRRGFVAALSAASVPLPGWAAAGDPVVLGAAQTPDTTFVSVGLRTDGSVAFSVPLPDRAHAGAAHPHYAEAVVVARRPGRFAVVLDCVNGTVRHRLTAPEGRHFYGHAAFSTDGHLLFTTENDFASGAGRIGVWDRRLAYERIDEFSSHGVGPHEILRLPSGTLAVANGGIRTHPETGRKKLNLATMRPNLSILRFSGTLIDQVDAPDHQNSLRHIACNQAGHVFAGFQWQGDPYDTPELVGIYRDGRFDMAGGPDMARQFDGYVGSVAALGQAGVVVTSPRGGRLQVIDGGGRPAFGAPSVDICGLATCSVGTIATTGHGRVFRLSQTDIAPIATHNLAFDNHLIAL